MKRVVGVVSKLNLGQRVVIVIGWGLALTFFGEWVATLHGFNYGFATGIYNCTKAHPCSGIGSLPSQPIYTGLHPWAIMLVWVGLSAVGTVGAVWMLRVPGSEEPMEQT